MALQKEQIIISEIRKNMELRKINAYIGILLDFLRKIFYNRNKKGDRTHGHS